MLGAQKNLAEARFFIEYLHRADGARLSFALLTPQLARCDGSAAFP